jgi:hypothetical protein
MCLAQLAPLLAAWNERALCRLSSRAFVGATAENFKKGTSKRITAVDNAIMAS